jgi:uncharacterized protein
MSDLSSKREKLLATISAYGSCAVALSGGVDSAVVAQAAQMALGNRAVAVTGVSPSLASGEIEVAREVALAIGIRHVELSTAEMSDPSYVANAPDRCYHCKTELYSQMANLLQELGVTTIVNGANVDDLVDYRPGLRAADEHTVASPLAECGITKAEVRQLAAAWGLSIADKPASPCLSSRIAYGEQVTPERLAMIDGAEQLVRRLGLTEVRVRYHRGDLARIEVPMSSIAGLAEAGVRDDLVTGLKRLGFRYVTLDLEGFRSGNLNQLIPVEALTRKNP